MMLGDRQHVEAAAIMRRALDEAESPSGRLTSATRAALAWWLQENDPDHESDDAGVTA